ncbi:MAG: carbonic anhydrase [Stellaceae bacterium]
MDDTGCSCNVATAMDRHRFITLASATGAAGLATLTSTPFARAAGDTDTLLLNCMDYRLTAKTTSYMAREGMAGKYDQVILAGASLGAVTDKYPDWGRTFREHLAIAIELHHIRRVIAIDHRDCGAYKVILGHDYAAHPAEETRIHAEMLHRLRHEIRELHPKLGVELGLMALDGHVEPIA